MSKYKHLTASALIAGVVAIASTSVTAADKKNYIHVDYCSGHFGKPDHDVIRQYC